MGAAPRKCPMCGEMFNWKKVDTEKKGFSVGKAAAGAVLFGPIGLVGGALGKKNLHIIVEDVVLITNTVVNE